MSNSHKTCAQSQFLSTYIQPYSPHAKNDSDSFKGENQLLPRSKCTTPEPIINNDSNDSYKQSQQPHSLKHFPSQSYLQSTPRNNESSHASKNPRRSPEPRCCICSQAGHYRSDCPQLNNRSYLQSQSNQQFQQSQQPSFHQSQMKNYSINTPKNHQDRFYSSKDKYLTPEPNTNNHSLNEHFKNDYSHFIPSYLKSQPNQQLQQLQQLSSLDQSQMQILSISTHKIHQNHSGSSKNESQNSLIYLKNTQNTQKNHQDQTHSFKNKRATSEPNINQLNIVQSQKAPKQEQARDGFFSRILRKKSDLNKEK
ncbi:33196_t:CDS:2 [Gigaspora margarita]|uniref:33196_t:CDS:1 n=1 Tax=Gigaspora margarita TaxID=4874 RepID=A0ABM8W574_GIGMA|nr:33196_t:CDS:2 [Gigaspora margarita]